MGSLLSLTRMCDGLPSNYDVYSAFSEFGASEALAPPVNLRYSVGRADIYPGLSRATTSLNKA